MNFTRISKDNLLIPIPLFTMNNCWIAGGAIRDSILGVPFDDIDVFGADLNLDTFAAVNLKDYKKVYDSKLLKTYI